MVHAVLSDGVGNEAADTRCKEGLEGRKQLIWIGLEFL